MKSLLAVVFLFVISSSGIAQTWMATGSPSEGWYAVASSADGHKLVAVVGNGLIYTSTNSGTTWVPTSAPSEFWYTVASSADGILWWLRWVPVSIMEAFTYRPMLEQPGHQRIPQSTLILRWLVRRMALNLLLRPWENIGSAIYMSTNSGTAWTVTTAPNATWFSVASSADATRLIAAAFNDALYISTNSGATWTASSVPGLYWHAVASSADGNTLAAVASPARCISPQTQVPSGCKRMCQVKSGSLLPSLQMEPK